MAFKTTGVVGMVEQQRAFSRQLTQVFQRSMRRVLKYGLWQEGKAFQKEFRQAVNGRFKVSKSKVGNLFSVYTAGEQIGDLVLGMFTIWNAAKVYEEGGSIGGAGGGWMLVPLVKDAYTAGGRIKKSWRDPKTGKFARDKTDDLFPVKLRPNMVLLFKAMKQVRSAAVARRSGVNVGQFRETSAEPWFIAIRVTRRSPVLKFFHDFETWFARPTEHLERAMERGLQEAFEYPLTGNVA